MTTNYINLSTKNGYNNSLQHFRVVTEVINFLQEGSNLANIVNDLETDDLIQKEQILPILNSVLVEKMSYSTRSFSLKRNIVDLSSIVGIISKWNKFDTVICYHHPQIGETLVNITESSQWEKIGDLSSEELIVVYTAQKEVRSFEREQVFLKNIEEVFQFGTADSHPEYNDPRYEVKEEVAQVEEETEQEETSSEKVIPKNVKMTPKYRCQVTNELFHNGNVEAWKNIIESYTNRYPHLDVFIFHDGKRVNNINSLFKWGKVKNGDVILFSVAGEDFKGIAKLQRYLFEGASNRFEQFLKKDINQPLRLF